MEPHHETGFPAGQSGEARIFLIQDDKLTAEVPLRRSILQSTLRQKYRSTGRHNPQRDGGPEKGLYRLHPIALRGTPSSITGMVGRRCTLSLAAPISASLGGLTAIGETAVSVPSKMTVNFLSSSLSTRVSPLIVDIVKPLHPEAMKK